MSLRVLIIPEDPTYNGAILRPLVERMMAEVGKPNARIHGLTNPKLGGYDQAVAAIKGILVESYRHFDLWLFLPDADRATNLDGLEQELRGRGINLLCCAAVPEVEVWLLAGHRQELALSWTEVREHSRLREDIFDPFLAVHGDARSVGGGRELLTRETLGNYQGLLQMCPELQALDARLRTLIVEVGART